MGEAIVVISLWLSTYRLTRLLVRDDFPPIAVQRARFTAWRGEASAWGYLVNCSWCAGVWIAGALTAGAWWASQHYPFDVPVPFLVWGAGAAVTGLLASWEREEPE